MRHPEIDEHDVAERYVAGKLSADEEARFEEHYLDCPACVRAVEDAERLRRGLQAVAAQDLATRGGLLAVLAALVSRRGALLASVVLVAALLPAGLAWQRGQRLDDELAAARLELAGERQPRINTPILELLPHRGGEAPARRISLEPEPEWIVLAVELGDTAQAAYRATLSRADGEVVWEAPGLEPSYRGTLTLSLHSSLLPPGEYLLRLDGETRRELFPLSVVMAP